MRMCQRAAGCALLVFLAVCTGTILARAQSKPIPSRIVRAVDNSRVVTLPGNTSPLARAEFDQGAVDADLPMTHMLLLLQRSAQQESELADLLDQQSDPGSSNYHQWLTPTEFGRRFGPSDADVAQVTGWLQAQGMSVDRVSNGRVTVEFSGTASQVKSAFHTEIHRYLVDGSTHYANVSDPEIPEALSPVVAGVASLHNFFPRSMAVEGDRVRRDASTGRFVALDPATERPTAEFTRTNSSGNTKEDVTPTDFATIYNVLPLWNAGINGAGQTIAIAGESDINLADVATFESSFGLPNNVPNVIHNGTAPGYTSSQEEQTLDVEWAGAVAPGATITLVVTANTNTTNGFQLSAQYVIDNQVATILSESYGGCEQSLGTTGNATYNALWQQGAAEGISIFGAAGDQGSAGCENSNIHTLNPATTGLAVNGVASSPYITAVGGTDFLWQQSAAGTYWSATNGINGATALAYIPEIAWNATCVNPYVVALYGATSAESNCNTLAGNSATSNLVFTTGGAGGISACTTYAGGRCSGGYAKPSWQTGAGVPADGKRDLPDMSLFAGSSIPYGAASTSYIICYSGSYPCSYSNSTDVVYQEIGGTSVSAPAMAGVMALVQQKLGRPQGMVNPVLYQLAAAEASLAACNSSSVSGGNSCVFYDTTKGSNAMPCKSGSTNCTVTTSGDTIGLLSGYNAAAGYDQATGLGSVNVANLVTAWAAVPAAKITFVLANKTYGAAAFAVSASSASTGAFSYSIVSGPATISGATITITGAGTVVVNAFQAAAQGYSAGSAIATFTVTPATPALNLTIPNKTYGVAPFAIAATSNSTGALAYTILSGPATLNGSTVTVTGAGTVTVQVSQAATSNYAAASTTATFSVAAIAPTITFSLANQTYGEAPFAVSASSNSTGTITYSIVSGPATISGATITLTGTGTVVLQAAQAAAGNYTASATTAAFTVSAASPAITFNIAGQTFGAAPFTVGASSNSTGAFTYSIVSGPATLSGSTITVTGAGSVTVQATQAAVGNYAAASATTTFTVSQANATITFAIANQTYGAGPLTVSATSASTGGFTYSVLSGPATIAGSTLTMTAAGTVVVQAAQVATTNYTAQTATASFTISPATPTLTFSIANQTYGTAPFLLSASSTSNGAFTYSVVSGPATVSGSTLTITGAGAVVVQVAQAVTVDYTGASKTASFTVSTAAPTITFAIANQIYGVAPFNVSASSNSTGAFTYSVASGPATVNGSTVTIMGAGTVVIMGSQAPTANYSAGSATASFTVAQQAPSISFVIPNQSYSAAPFSVAASSNSTGALTYSIVSGPATINGSTVTVTGAGTVVVMASQAATANYSAGSANASFSVAQANGPTIQFAVADQTYGAAPFHVAASSNSQGAFSYSIVSGSATISGDIITLTGSGRVVVLASQAAAGSYAAGSATASFTVSPPTTPTLSFAIANQSAGTAPFKVSASSNSTGILTYSILSGPATLSGSTITLNGSGTVVVMASQAAAGSYAAGSATASFTVSPLSANLTWSPSTTLVFAGNPLSARILDATADVAGTITYTATSGAGVATALTANSTLLTPGTYTLTASLTPSSSLYSTASTSITLQVAGSYIWAVNPAGSLTEFHGDTAVNPSAIVGGGTGAAIDAANSVWTLNAGGASLAEISASGVVMQSGVSGGGLRAATSLAIDGSGSIWLTNANNSVSVFTNSGTAVSPATGYTGGNLSAPTGVAIDTSGNVWIINAGNNSVTEIVGAATPVSPIANAVQNKTLGVRP